MWTPTHFEHLASFRRPDRRDSLCEGPARFRLAGRERADLLVGTDLRALIALDLREAQQLPDVPEVDRDGLAGRLLRTLLEPVALGREVEAGALQGWLTGIVPEGDGVVPGRINGVVVDLRLTLRALAPMPAWQRVIVSGAALGAVEYLDVFAPDWRVIVASFKPPAGMLGTLPAWWSTWTFNPEAVKP